MKKIVLGVLLLGTALFAREAREIVSSVCYDCHGSQMEQSCMGVSRIVNTLDTKSIHDALKGYKHDHRNSYGMGSTMQEKASDLSDDEIKALSEYIPTLR